MTVLEAIQKSRQFLETKGVESARLESELLLGHVLTLPRLQLYLKLERTLSEAETAELRELVKRRGAREPLQHILGTACFWGLDFEVTNAVLIPRPETERLAELGWKFLNSLDRAATFLDFGTGSGCIAVTLCHFAKAASGTALDKSAAALAIATRNAIKHHVSDRLQFIESDAFAVIAEGSRFDLIISNPPYILSAEIDTLQEEVRKHDPRMALDGGADGLDFYRLLATESANFLADGGRLMFEFGDGQERAIGEIFQQNGWRIESVENDLAGKPRLIVASHSAR